MTDQSAENDYITDEQRARWRKDATPGHWMLWNTTLHAARVVALLDVLGQIRAALVEEYGETGHDIWCPRSPGYEMVSDHPRGDRPCDCIAGKLWPLVGVVLPPGGQP